MFVLIELISIMEVKLGHLFNGLTAKIFPSFAEITLHVLFSILPCPLFSFVTISRLKGFEPLPEHF
jgi:hypothetical protein